MESEERKMKVIEKLRRQLFEEFRRRYNEILPLMIEAKKRNSEEPICQAFKKLLSGTEFRILSWYEEERRANEIGFLVYTRYGGDKHKKLRSADYVIEDCLGNLLSVEIELYGSSYKGHYEPNYADVVVCLIKPMDRLPVPVISLEEWSRHQSERMRERWRSRGKSEEL
jgi:hypothetical protein